MMGFGIAKLIGKLIIRKNVINFCIRKNLIGFENANSYLRRLDKDSMVHVLKANGATIGINCDIETLLIFHNCQDFSNLVIGDNVHLGKNCFIDLRGKVIIEDNVVVSMQTTFITHMDISKSELRSKYPASFNDIIIKSNSYIGANSTILQGVEVGENSLVAAGSVVTRNIPPFTIVAGVPAKKIRNLN